MLTLQEVRSSGFKGLAWGSEVAAWGFRFQFGVKRLRLRVLGLRGCGLGFKNVRFEKGLGFSVGLQIVKFCESEPPMKLGLHGVIYRVKYDTLLSITYGRLALWVTQGGRAEVLRVTELSWGCRVHRAHKSTRPSLSLKVA